MIFLIILAVYLVSALVSGMATGRNYILSYRHEEDIHGRFTRETKDVIGVEHNLLFEERFWLSFIPAVNTVSAFYWSTQYIVDRDFNREAHAMLKNQGKPHLQKLRAYKDEQREARIKELERLTSGSN